MFGFSLAELIVVFLIILIFVRPADLPEIAHFFGKVFYRFKHWYNEIKASLKEVEKEFTNEINFDDLKHEIQRGIAEEKAKLKDDLTVIVDMHGNEHRVPNISELRADLSKDDLTREIIVANERNKKL